MGELPCGGNIDVKNGPFIDFMDDFMGDLSWSLYETICGQSQILCEIHPSRGIATKTKKSRHQEPKAQQFWWGLGELQLDRLKDPKKC